MLALLKYFMLYRSVHVVTVVSFCHRFPFLFPDRAVKVITTEIGEHNRDNR